MKAHMNRLALERFAEDEYYKKIKFEDVDIANLPYLFNDMISNVLKEINCEQGVRILDLGAGTGILSVIMASKGASVIAIDISKTACEIIRSLSIRHKVQNKIKVINGTLDDCKAMPLFDYIVCLNSLHHMDVSQSVSVIRDLLKEKGKAIFIEPLMYNPLALIYRKFFHNEGRTNIESPLRIKDVSNIKKCFSEVKIRGLYILSSTLLSFERLFKMDERSKSTYWLFGLLHNIDAFISNIPLLKYLSWKVMIVASK